MGCREAETDLSCGGVLLPLTHGQSPFVTRNILLLRGMCTHRSRDTDTRVHTRTYTCPLTALQALSGEPLCLLPKERDSLLGWDAWGVLVT